jgi:Leucine-rich repeat (LRR) protein
VRTIANVKDSSTTITVTGNYSITAEFEEIPEYNLTISSTAGGNITKPGVGTFTYEADTKVPLVADRDVGFGFVNWTGDVEKFADVNKNRTSITMKGHYSITANFEKEEPVNFADPNLEAAIRKAIAIYDRSIDERDDIYPSDLKGLTQLDTKDWNVSDLTGLEHCTDLTVLHLYNKQVDDISPLVNLAKLENLDLERNQTSDISPLANLTSLTRLSLGANQISDISPLAKLTKLTYLSLGGNQISDISPVANLTKLTYLSLGNNQISDISPLAKLTSLTNLSLGSNQISDISPLAKLTSLTDLSLEFNKISDISSLANLTSLKDLNLSVNQIIDIEPLVANPGLSREDSEEDEVDLWNNPLSLNSTNTYIPQLEARGVKVQH